MKCDGDDRLLGLAASCAVAVSTNAADDQRIEGRESWIGPRPEALVLSNVVGELPFYRYRHFRAAGTVRLAQVTKAMSRRRRSTKASTTFLHQIFLPGSNPDPPFPDDQDELRGSLKVAIRRGVELRRATAVRGDASANSSPLAPIYYPAVGPRPCSPPRRQVVEA